MRLLVFERKKEICFYQPFEFCSWEGCNYCAGGISPRLADTLEANGLGLPSEVVEGEASTIIVHGDWKSIELPIPEGRRMLSVFRGSRPREREGRYLNFDSFLLRTAQDEGAEVISAEVTGADLSPSGKPILRYRPATAPPDRSFPASAESPTAADLAALAEHAVPKEEPAELAIEADFLVFAAGVNRHPGMEVAADPLIRSLCRMIPGFRPPRVRQTVIAELEALDGRPLALMEGEVHFVQYGSPDLQIEMSSLIPKDRWITVALVGKTIDEAAPGELRDLVKRFVELPHIRRLLPPGVEFRAACSCHPNMTVGAARKPYADRIAVTGDMAVSRLYKDGLYSAYVTTGALADCILDKGIDAGSLRRWYAPVIRQFHADNRYGRAVFLLSSAVFAHPALSRVLYQAILTERKTKPRHKRRLAGVLWQTASGDASYRHILRAMLHPVSWWLIFTGGLLATIRNKLTERVFGLDWRGVGRYPTGVPLEEVARKRQELFAVLGWTPSEHSPQLEKMYSVRIRARPEAIFRQLGAFGEPDRAYLRPRFVHISRTAGKPNQEGATVRYDVGLRRHQRAPSALDQSASRPPAPATPATRQRLLRLLSFSVRLERVVPDHYLLYRILDGFGRGGIFAFDIAESGPGVSLLTIYVGFDFPRGESWLGRAGWRLFRFLFPAYAHDVVWNHSLCLIKSLAEESEVAPVPYPSGSEQAGPAPLRQETAGHERTRS